MELNNIMAIIITNVIGIFSIIIIEPISAPKTYPESSQTSKLKYFTKIIHVWKLLTFFAKRSIIDVWLSSEYTSVNSSCSFR